MVSRELVFWTEIVTSVGACGGWVAATYAFIGQYFYWPVSPFWYFFVLRVMGFWVAVISFAICGMIAGMQPALIVAASSLVAAIVLGGASGAIRFGVRFR